MPGACKERLQRLIAENQKAWEDSVKRKAELAETAKAARLNALDVDTEINNFNDQIDSLTDDELKSKGTKFLREKLAEAKELDDEKSRRQG